MDVSSTTVDVDRRPGRFTARERPLSLGDVPLRMMKSGQEHAAAFPNRVGHDGTIDGFQRRGSHQALGRDLKKLGADAEEVVFWQAAAAPSG